VLITSRDQIWPPGQVLDVPVLDLEVAAEFLVNRTGDPDRQAALELASELGGLPLALEQAAAYIQATGNNVASYLASFRQRRTDMLARGEPTGYSGTVATTWALAFQHLQQGVSGAVGLLRLLANCAPEAIPLYLLLQSRPRLADKLGPEVAPLLVPLLEDELAAGDAIAALRRYSLVSPPADGFVSVHQLVQVVTLGHMPAEVVSQWRDATAALIEAAIPTDTDLPETWPICAALLPHAQAALSASSNGIVRLANDLGERGSYSKALELQQWLVHGLERASGSEHPDALAARGNLAYWTGEAGDAAGARDQIVALLPVFERVLGLDHRHTLAARANLARWTGRTGDAAGARDQYAALLSAREGAQGSEDPDTLFVRHNLARWTGEAGDAVGARDQYAALLPVYERVLDPEHPHTLTVRAGLATWTGEAGDAVEARDQYAALLQVREGVSGPEHPDTLTARANLAYWSRQAGDAEPGVK
jgi:hypothetical protein